MTTNVQQTSLMAFWSLKDLGRRQQEVFRVLGERGPLSNTQISHILNMPINSITGRTKELREKGLVKESHKGICSYTGKTVIFWVAEEAF